MDNLAGGFYGSPHKTEYTGIKTLRNLTAKQISSMAAEDSSTLYIIDGNEVSNVVICGYVSEVKKTSAGIAFKLFDTTGEVDCSFWTSSGYDESIADRIRENACLKLIGSLKVFKERKSVSVSVFNEVGANHLLHHLTSALYQHLHHSNMLEKNETEDQKDGMAKIHQDILEVYRNNQGEEEGLDIEIVTKMLIGRYSESDVKKAVDELLANCHLYWVSETAYRTTL